MISYQVKTGNALHKTDPRAKLLMLTGLCVLFFLPLPLPFAAGYFALLLMFCSLVLGLHSTFAPLWQMKMLFALIAVLTPLFDRSGTALFGIGGEFIIISTGGLAQAAKLMLRLAAVSTLCNAFFLTTELNIFLQTLRFFGVPHKGALIVSIIIRYVPLLSQAYFQIRDSRTLLGKKLHIPTILTGLTIYTVRQIPILAMTLESRGAFRKGPKSAYFSLPAKSKMALDMAFCAAIMSLTYLPLFIFRS